MENSAILKKDAGIMDPITFLFNSLGCPLDPGGCKFNQVIAWITVVLPDMVVIVRADE